MQALLYAALAKAQGEFPEIAKTKTAKVQTRKGPGYAYTYADLADIRKAVTPALSKNGLAVVQVLDYHQINEAHSEFGIETRLLHGDGGSLAAFYPIQQTKLVRAEGGEPLQIPLTPQEMGSAITYARRYALCALLGVVAEDDDDGRQATDASKETQQAKNERQEKFQQATEAQMKGLHAEGKNAAGEDSHEFLRYLYWTTYARSRPPQDISLKSMSEREASVILDFLKGDKERIDNALGKFREFQEGGPSLADKIPDDSAEPKP